jgi:hypothetical protein
MGPWEMASYAQQDRGDEFAMRRSQKRRWGGYLDVNWSDPRRLRHYRPEATSQDTDQE